MTMEIPVFIKLKSVWRCPSNIAIVKYWGKYGNQLPCNPSLSLTLSESFTEVELLLTEKTTEEPIELRYFFEGVANEKFESRIQSYLTANKAFFPFVRHPHSEPFLWLC